MKNIIIGVSSSISIYKSLTLISILKKSGYSIRTVLTKHGSEMISPSLFSSLSNNKTYTSLFTNRDFDMEHISLSKWGDILIIYPATANIIGKLSSGIADDLLTTLFISFKKKKIIAPAMNPQMYINSIVQENIERLKNHNVEFLEPNIGIVACGDEGQGRLAEPEEAFSLIKELSQEQILKQKNSKFKKKRFIITAGATREYIDSVRFITNRSTGKMGLALSSEAYSMGHKVILITGNIETALLNSYFAEKDIYIINRPLNTTEALEKLKEKGIIILSAETTEKMQELILNFLREVDILIMAAAPVDFKPKTSINNKIKKHGKVTIQFINTPDILKSVSDYTKKHNITIKRIGFAAEHGNNTEEAKRKLIEKNLDMIVLNDISKHETGFASDMNAGEIFFKDGTSKNLNKMNKREFAKIIINTIQDL